MQEQALLDAHERMEILENRNQSNENAMTKIRSALSSALSKTASRSKNPRFVCRVGIQSFEMGRTDLFICESFIFLSLSHGIC